MLFAVVQDYAAVLQPPQALLEAAALMRSAVLGTRGALVDCLAGQPFLGRSEADSQVMATSSEGTRVAVICCTVVAVHVFERPQLQIWFCGGC